MVICLSLLFNSVSKLCAMYKKYFKNLHFLFHFLALNPLDHYLALIHVSFIVFYVRKTPILCDCLKNN